MSANLIAKDPPSTSSSTGGGSGGTPGTPVASAAASASAASMAANAAANAAASSSKVPWPNSAEHYEVKEVIGVGATAVVHAAYCKPRDEKCAIKRINLEKWNTSMDELLKEIQAVSSCSNENVVSYFTSFVHKEELWLILRLLSSGSLLDIIRHKMKTQDCKHGVLDESTIATVLKEVLRGLEYLHNHGHIHRDIKAGNILLGSEGQVQIADFGVSAWLASGGDTSRAKSRHTFVGTPCWMAPEVMEQVTGYDYKADIWSFGITAIELATGTAPYHKYPPMKVLMLTLQNDPPSLDSGAEDKDQFKAYGRTFRKMISECLQKDPSKRPTATELLKNQFFKNKAKDKKFLQQNLVASAPTIDNRVQKAKNAQGRKPGSSGVFKKNPDGEWVWSSDDEDDGGAGKDKAAAGKAPVVASGNSLDVPQQQQVGVPAPATPQQPPQLPVAPPPLPMTAPPSGVAHPPPAAPAVPQQVAAPAAAAPRPLSVVLRMRNPRRELNDIRFEYQPFKDTTEGIADELLNNGLITRSDVTVMASSMRQLIENPPPTRVITFRVSTGFNADEVPDERSLLGFAQLSLATN